MAGKGVRGRKPKLSEKVIVEAGKMAEAGNFDITICQALGIQSTTWYRWLNDGEAILNNEETEVKYTPEMQELLCDFYYTIKKAQGQSEAQLLGYIEKEAKTGTWQAAAWILERKYRNRWAREIPAGGGESENALDTFLNGVEDKADAADNDYGEYQDPLDNTVETDKEGTETDFNDLETEE